MKGNEKRGATQPNKALEIRKRGRDDSRMGETTVEYTYESTFDARQKTMLLGLVSLGPWTRGT